VPWFKLFVARDPEFDISNLTHAEFDRLAHLGRQMYGSLMNANDPDLAAFRDAGGKMVSFHGLVCVLSSCVSSRFTPSRPRLISSQADNIIPPKNTERYYNEVTSIHPDVDNFYRHYNAPGLGHCWGGVSGAPTNLFAQLRAWVENGTAPGSTPVNITDQKGNLQPRILCPYPRKAKFDVKCGNSSRTDCWSCTAKEAEAC
jgi:hypothetical protein